MKRYAEVLAELRGTPRRWLVTGVAGFIGSNLLEALLGLGQQVVGLDDFSSGLRANLDDVRGRVGDDAWARFQLHEGDIRSLERCRTACAGADFVLHQAAMVSVPATLEDPLQANAVIVDGFLNVLVAARDAGVKRVVYASSSAVYGDCDRLPQTEDCSGRVASPYGAGKLADDLYARVFADAYGLSTVGLRYFNVFGRRQNPAGQYGAVLPRWTRQICLGERCTIFGDGETTRDFVHVSDVVQANLLAAASGGADIAGEAFNVGYGGRTTLNELYAMLRGELSALRPGLDIPEPEYAEFRAGDLRHSQASIEKIRTRLGFEPQQTVRAALGETLPWYVETLSPPTVRA